MCFAIDKYFTWSLSFSSKVSFFICFVVISDRFHKLTDMISLKLLILFLPYSWAVCGYNARYDHIRLLAEQNTEYIADFLDNTNDVDMEYRTKVFPAGRLKTI